jgi:hypothetical protein
MRLFIINFDFDDDFGHLTNSEALDQHEQIKKYLKRQKAIQLSPSSFLLKSKLTSEQLLSEISPFLDRSEGLFIFDIAVNDWYGFGNKKILNAISKGININLFQ